MSNELEQKPGEQKPEEKAVETSNKINWVNVLGWIFGLTFLLNGLGEIFHSVILGLTGIILGLLIFPPTKNALFSKGLSRNAWYISIMVAFAFLIALGQYNKSKYEEKQQIIAKEQAEKKLNMKK